MAVPVKVVEMSDVGDGSTGQPGLLSEATILVAWSCKILTSFEGVQGYHSAHRVYCL